MRKGNFCKYKSCGATTKHMSGYCQTHNKQWMAGYRYALKQLQGCQSPETCSRGEMLIAGDSEVSRDDGGDRCSRTLELTFTWEGQESEGVRQSNGMGLPSLPHLVRPGDGHGRKKEKTLGCGTSKTD